MTVRKKNSRLLISGLVLAGSLLVHGQTPLSKPAPKPLELTATLQNDIQSAPRSLADQRNALAYDPWASEPALEKTRQSDDPASANIQLDTKFECGYAPNVSKASPTHFAINVNKSIVYMFYFRLTGVEGKTVRIDLKNLDPNDMLKLLTLNPVYSSDLPVADTSSMDSQAPFTAVTKTVENGGAGSIMIPDTSKQQWHFIENVWIDHDKKTLSFVNTFTTNSVYIAMKYPYTPALNEKLFAQWEKNLHAKVFSLGSSVKGRPLQLIKITDIPEDQQSKHPALVIYAREHADEHDSSWACKGAIEFLLGNSSEAVALRNQAIFHIIPLLDPDAALSAAHRGILTSFGQKYQQKESRSYAEYFAKWVDGGGRLDLTINLHNVESAELVYHMSSALVEPLDARFTLATTFNKTLFGSLNQQGYRASDVDDSGYLPFRLGGWLDDTYGAMHMAYELNSQEPHRHLLQSELMAMGATTVKVAGNYVSGPEGKELRESVDAILNVRKAAKGTLVFNEKDGVFEREYKIKEWRVTH